MDPEVARHEVEKPTPRVIGPFLGHGTEPGAINIFLALPEHVEISEVACEIKSANNTVRQTATPTHATYRLLKWSFTQLEPSERYNYSFTVDGQPLDLEGGLHDKDCYFYGPEALHKNDSFVLMSCHNPYQIERGSAEYGWAMWKKLDEMLDIRSQDGTLKHLRLLVMAGDQVYNDDVEVECLNKLDQADYLKSPNHETFTQTRIRLILQYRKYWSEIHYRRVLAKIPSVTMWDDHDITDGWGGRPESFDEFAHGRFKKKWWNYFELCREAFVAYQACRNPDFPAKLEGKAFSTFIDLGSTRIFLLDFRSEKNSKRQLLWEKNHASNVLNALRSTPATVKNLFVVSPVVPLRTNFEGDRRLNAFVTLFFNAVQSIEERPWLDKMLSRIAKYGWLVPMLLFVLTFQWNSIWIYMFLSGLAWILIFIVWAFLHVPELPKLSDDLNDGLSSDINFNSLVDILRVLLDIQASKQTKVTILSGDIHAAGITEIIERTKNGIQRICQVVASPVSYSPMPKSVEGFTTTTSEMVISNDGGNKIFARNIFYVSKRNFCEIYPSKISRRPYQFHFEGHETPLCMPDSYGDE
jgi:hypothetical protein